MRMALVGPTAVGKTAVGVLLAQRLGAEIVSADSMQVYRRMDIGTAKPTVDEQHQARFHLIDVVEPDREWTLADAQQAGSAANAGITGRGALPLIVGGTGLYVRALTTRLDIPVTPPNEAIRERWRGIAAERGNDYIHGELARVDPEAAARIHVNDVKRIVRALEVFETLGVPMSVLHARNQAEAAGGDPVLVIGLNYADRRLLYQQIEARVDQMMADGFLEEVRGLIAAGYGPKLKSMQSLGYRHMCAHIVDGMDLAAAVDEIKRDTRHFARRQLIWFRGDDRVRWLNRDGKTAEALADEAVQVMQEYCQAHSA